MPKATKEWDDGLVDILRGMPRPSKELEDVIQDIEIGECDAETVAFVRRLAARVQVLEGMRRTIGAILGLDSARLSR